jgi:hypothetical protein
MRGPFFETVKFGPGAWAQPQARRNELELVCVECGAVSMFGAKGWRGYHTCDDEAAMSARNALRASSARSRSGFAKPTGGARVRTPHWTIALVRIRYYGRGRPSFR